MVVRRGGIGLVLHPVATSAFGAFREMQGKSAQEVCELVSERLSAEGPLAVTLRAREQYEYFTKRHDALHVRLVGTDQDPANTKAHHRKGDSRILLDPMGRILPAVWETVIVEPHLVFRSSLAKSPAAVAGLGAEARTLIDVDSWVDGDVVPQAVYLILDSGARQIEGAVEHALAANTPIAVPLLRISDDAEVSSVPRDVRPLDGRAASALILRSLGVGLEEVAMRVLEAELDGDALTAARGLLDLERDGQLGPGFETSLETSGLDWSRSRRPVEPIRD